MKILRLDGESPFDYIQRVKKAEEAERTQREIEATVNMKYGLLKISQRRMAIIKYLGVSRRDAEMPDEYYEVHYSFLDGCESMPYNIAVAHLKYLITRGKDE